MASFTPQSSTRTGTDVMLEVRRTLGDTAGTLFASEDILAWINAGQREIAQQVELFGRASINVVAKQAEYTIDVELAKRIREVQALIYKGTRLQAMTFQQAQEEWMSPNGLTFPTEGEPTRWFQYNRTVTLVPAPPADGVGAMEVYFSRQAVDLTTIDAELDIPDSHYNALIMYVHGRAYMLTQEQELAATSMSAMQTSIREQQGRERRSQSNTYTALVADEDYY